MARGANVQVHHSDVATVRVSIPSSEDKTCRRPPLEDVCVCARARARACVCVCARARACVSVCVHACVCGGGGGERGGLQLPLVPAHAPEPLA